MFFGSLFFFFIYTYSLPPLTAKYILVFLSSTRSCVLELSARFQDGHKLYIYISCIIYIHCPSILYFHAFQIGFTDQWIIPLVSYCLLLSFSFQYFVTFFFFNFSFLFSRLKIEFAYFKKRTNNFLSLFLLLQVSRVIQDWLLCRVGWREETQKRKKERSKEINNTNKAQHGLQSRRSGCLFRSIQHTHTYIRLRVHFAMFFCFVLHSPSLKAT